MPDRILVLYGSYRSDRMGIRLANYLVRRLAERGAAPDLVDARSVGLPMLDRMYKEYPKGDAPVAMERLAEQIRSADAFVFVTGEYNWGVQPGLKNLTDHFLEEWFWRPAAIASYSAGRLSGARSNSAWHATLSNGHGGHIEHADGWADRPVARRGRAASRLGQPVARPCLREVR
jgi:NAD(P)H-dependent FMN reductase